jgi:hypothetical protein
MPGSDPERVGVFEGSHLSVAAASPRFLLVMKLLAARAERDTDDIKSLCGFHTAEDGIELVGHAYPEARFLLEELFPLRARDRAHEGRELGSF